MFVRGKYGCEEILLLWVWDSHCYNSEDTVFWYVMLSSLVEIYWRIDGTCCLILRVLLYLADLGIIFLWNIGKIIPCKEVSHRRRRLKFFGFLFNITFSIPLANSITSVSDEFQRVWMQPKLSNLKALARTCLEILKRIDLELSHDGLPPAKIQAQYNWNTDVAHLISIHNVESVRRP